MGTFFQGRRRKLGCLFLVVAWGLMIAWIRSPLNRDQVFWEVGPYQVVFASNQNGLWYVITEFSDRRYHPTMLRAQSKIFALPGPRIPFSADPFLHLKDWDWKYESRWDQYGFHFAKFNNLQPMRDICLTFRIMPHWCPVISLTIVSALLLLPHPLTSPHRPWVACARRSGLRASQRTCESQSVRDCQPTDFHVRQH